MSEFKIVIAFIFFLFQISCGKTNSKTKIEKTKWEEIDSLHLKEIYQDLYAEYEIEENENMSLNFGKVYYSPDSIIRIYHFEGEGCGAYCNPIYENYVGFRNKELQQILSYREEDLNGRIDSLVQLDSTDYLVFGNYSSRPRSIESINCKVVNHLKLNDNYELVWKLNSCCSNLTSEEESICELRYNQPTKSISYKYQMVEAFNSDVINIVEGTWEYNDGIYIESVLEPKITNTKDEN